MEGVIGRLRRFLPVLPTTLASIEMGHPTTPPVAPTAPPTVPVRRDPPANDAARLRTASVRQVQRKCLLTASVRQNERHLSAIASHQPTPVLARLGNAASQLPLRGQPRRKALRGY